MVRSVKRWGGNLSRLEREFHEQARVVYEYRLGAGVAREQARKDLPLSTYTRVYWKMDLHNLLHFLELRLDSHAQLEIRQYAEVIAHWVSVFFPKTWEAFGDYKVNAITFSRMELQVFRDHPFIGLLDLMRRIDKMVENKQLLPDMSSREVTEFRDKLRRIYG